MSEDEGPQFEPSEDEELGDEAEHWTAEEEREITEREAGESENSEETPKDIDEKFETFEELSRQLADGDFSENPEVKEQLLTRIQENFFQAIQKPDESVKAKPNLDYTTYNFARSSAILTLEFSWAKIDIKVKSLIEQLRDTNLTDEKINDLEAVFEKFQRTCIQEIIDYKKPKDKARNDLVEPEKFEEIIKKLPDIYSAFFDVFLESVTNWDATTSRRILDSASETLKFRAYNLDLRNKKEIHMRAGNEYIPDYTRCNFDYYFSLGRETAHVRGLLFQGYWQVESIMTDLRNHTEHWKKRGNKLYLNNELKRSMQDPISDTESPGNFIILINILVLICHHFIDVMQTWVDTDTILKK